MSSQRIPLKEWEHRELADQELKDQTAKTIADELTQSGKLKILELRKGLSIQATSYVGSLSIGELHFIITPKLPIKSLLALLRYAYNLRRLALFSPEAQGYATLTFQDLLVLQLAAEVTELLSRGLHRRYEPIQDNLQCPRGKIDFQSLMRKGGISESRLPCRHHPRIENTLLNQFILSGLLLGARITNDLPLRTRLRQLAGLMIESVAQIRLDRETVRCVRRVEDRLTLAYRPASKIIELLLNGFGITLDDTIQSTPAPGFLFDMNRFFQELLSRFLRENLTNLTVVDEYRLKGMIVYDQNHNPLHRTPPVLRPDYVILKGHEPVAILDAKYRDLWENPLPREMLYQLSIYALIRFTREKSSVILYPTIKTNAREARIQILDPLTLQSRAMVILRPVKLLSLESLLSQPKSLINSKQRQAFAQYLVFGNAPQMSTHLEPARISVASSSL